MENKNVILLGDFNFDLLHCETSYATRKFLDLFSASLTPKITIPTRLTVHSRTLSDNIFTNSVDENTISGNLECCISDHLAQFLIFPNQKVLQQNSKKNYKRNYKNLDPKKFKEELQRINWNTALVNNNNDVNQSLESLLTITNSLPDKHAPMKQITKKQIKTKSKPWITKAILTSINKKYKIRSKSLKAKDQNKGGTKSRIQNVQKYSP